MDPEYTGPRSASVSSVKDVTAADKYTVQVVLKEAYAPILEDINYGILEKQLFANTPVKDFDKNPVSFKPVGAGPYKFVDYKRGQYVMLERNDSWFMSEKDGGAPFIKSIRYKIIPDESSAQAALENGEIDVLQPEPKEVARLEKDFADKLTPYDWERNGWGYMSFNVTRPHLNNKLVRQALTYGLDRQSIIAGVMDGRAVIPAGPISSVSWAYDPSIKAFPYDPAKAKQLLEQAGYKMGANGIYEKDGQPLKLGFYGSAGSPLIEGIAALAKKDWKQIGVDLDVQLIDYNAMQDNFLKPGRFDVSFAGMSLSLDPDQSALFHSSQVKGFNKGRYSSPQVDALLEQGVRESDKATRKGIYSDYQKQLMDDAPVLFVYANKNTDFVSSKFQGVVNFPGAGADYGYIYRWYATK
jgi:peptide/nickel transport system substrate-binding protein